MTGATMARAKDGGGVVRTAKYQNMRGKLTYSDEELIASLRWAATKLPFTLKVAGRKRTFDGVLSSEAYAVLAKKHDLPSLATYFDRFDTWNSALGAADLDTNPSRRDFYERTSEDAMLSSVRDCMKELGALPSLADYDAWRRESCPDAPSSVLIRKRLGGWLKVMERMESVAA